MQFALLNILSVVVIYLRVPTQRYTLFRFLTVLVMVMAWLVATNHCALAMLAESLEGAGDKVCDSCSDEQHEDKSAPHSSHAEASCCKVFTSVAETPVPLAQSALLATLDFVAVAPLVAPQFQPHDPTNLANGPPGVCRFTSCDLQRCHPGNAPPYLS